MRQGEKQYVVGMLGGQNLTGLKVGNGHFAALE
jgi:hypothetical protein